MSWILEIIQWSRNQTQTNKIYYRQSSKSNYSSYCHRFKNIEVINTHDANGNCIEFCDDIEDEDDDEEDEYYEDDVEE